MSLTRGGVAIGTKVVGAWTSDLTDAAYGGPTDLWGATMTQEAVTSSDFEIRLRAKYVGAAGNSNAFVDGALIRIHYCY